MIPKPVVEVPAKGFEGYKTIVTNVLMLVAVLLPEVREFCVQMGWGTEQIVVAVTVVNLLLRMVTKGPVGKRLMVLNQGIRWLTGRKIK